jgi:serine/threonine protein kinase
MIGQTISHYKILEKLGEGGMGVVYRARDTTLDRDVALKFLPTGLESGGPERARFLQEARAASALNHPNICDIHDIGETSDGRMFMVMACYEGETLKSRIANGPLQIEGAYDVVTQIARGLQKAHEKGIVHRDVKPGNVIITCRKQGRVDRGGRDDRHGGVYVARTGEGRGRRSSHRHLVPRRRSV